MNKSEVTSQCTEEGFVRVVRNIVFVRCFLYNFRKVTIMNVTNMGKQVMFDLVVQATNQPRKNTATIREVCRCLHLMNRPAIFHFAILSNFEQFSFAYNMCSLKDQCEDQSRNRLHHKESNHNYPPWNWYQKNWKNDF